LQGTLTEAEVNDCSAKIIAALETQLGAILRSS
jgi:phenylalanyl-tRNA synthetase beta subunit